MQSTILKQKAYGTIEQYVSPPWRAVVLPYLDEEMRTTSKMLKLRFAWCMTGLTRGEYDSEERKRSKEKRCS